MAFLVQKNRKRIRETAFEETDIKMSEGDSIDSITREIPAGAPIRKKPKEQLVAANISSKSKLSSCSATMTRHYYPKVETLANGLFASA